MTKFKAGDEVIYVNEDGVFDSGEALTIKENDDSDYCPLFVSNGHRSEWVNTTAVKHSKPTKKQRIKALEAEVAELKAKVEAYEKAQATPIVAATLLVGDTIRIIDAEGITCNENCQYWGNGDIVKIVGEDGMDWHVSYKGGGSRHFYIRKEVEKHCVEKVVSG